MDDFLLHKNTAAAIDRAIATPSHAYIILGAEGSGRSQIATHVASKLLRINVADLAFEAQTKRIVPAPSIGIENVREIAAFLKLKTTGNSAVRRVVLIDDAHLMTIEAQNAALKLFEEPPADTVFILSADDKQPLLPTIQSRVQVVKIRTPSMQDALVYYVERGHTSEAVTRAYMIADGQAWLLQALLTEANDHSLVKAISAARSIASKSRYERLLLIDEIVRDKSYRGELLYAFKRLFAAALMQSAKKDLKLDVGLYINRLQAVLRAETSLAMNGTPKLVFTDLFMQL